MGNYNNRLDAGGIVILVNMILYTAPLYMFNKSAILHIYAYLIYCLLYLYTDREITRLTRVRRVSHTTYVHILHSIVFISMLCLYYCMGRIKIIPLTISYSIYFNQLAYTIVKSEAARRIHILDFYNSNKIFFGAIGLCYSIMYLHILQKYHIELVGLFLYSIICSPVLKWYTYNFRPDSFNFFLPIEYFMGYAVHCVRKIKPDE